MTAPAGVGAPAWARRRHAAGLVAVLARKHVRLRYRRTALGTTWAVAQPVLQAAVIAVVFQRLFRGMGVPNYPLFVLSGVLPWALTTRMLNSTTTAVVDNASLVKKVAASRLVYPLSAAAAALVLFVPSALVLVGAAAVSGTLGATLTLLPLAVAVQVAVVLGPALIASALFVSFRDVRFGIESALVMAFYATPIIYPSERLGSAGAELQRFNPMTGVLSLYRAAIAGHPVDGAAVAVSAVFGAFALLTGLAVYRRRAHDFADLA